MTSAERTIAIKNAILDLEERFRLMKQLDDGGYRANFRPVDLTEVDKRIRGVGNQLEKLHAAFLTAANNSTDASIVNSGGGGGK